MIELEIDQHFSAPPQRVFDAVTDHKRIEEWQKGTRVTIEKPRKREYWPDPEKVPVPFSTGTPPRTARGTSAPPTSR